MGNVSQQNVVLFESFTVVCNQNDTDFIFKMIKKARYSEEIQQDSELAFMNNRSSYSSMFVLRW